MMHIARSLLPTPVLVAVDVGCWRGLADERTAALATGAGLDRVLAGLSAVTLQAVLGWLTVLVVLTALEPLAGRPLTSYAGCPRSLRRLLVVTCGVAATATLAGPAGAVRPPLDHVQPAAAARLEGLSPPDRTTDNGPPGRVVVRPGDSLWSLARDRLGPRASDAAVDRLWRATYAANRARIGPDPDLIRPGTRLWLPDPAEEHR